MNAFRHFELSRNGQIKFANCLAMISTLAIVVCLISCSDAQVSKPTPAGVDSVITQPTHNSGPDSVPTVIITKDELLGKFDPANHPDFVKIEAAHTSKQNIYMRKEAYEHFKKMFEAARTDGVNLRIISATRNFDYQKTIWMGKWRERLNTQPNDSARSSHIMKLSAMPGTSRHHWGTDIDLNQLENSYFEKAEGKKIYDWLVAHANEYGFYQTYTSKQNGRTGYEEEKWHWSYKPLSEVFLSEYNRLIVYEDISGFDGANSAKTVGAIEKYVNGIDPQVKK